MPHEFGGCGKPVQQDLYGKFNIYTDNMDLAKIKPRWTHTNKHEFMVELPKNKDLNEKALDGVEDQDERQQFEKENAQKES